MCFIFVCIGCVKVGVDKDLLEWYLDCVWKFGCVFGVLVVDIVEFVESWVLWFEDCKVDEVSWLLVGVLVCVKLVVFDEYGKNFISFDFVCKFEFWKDDGGVDVVFVIGGVDGYGVEVLVRVDLKFVFGVMIWLYQIVWILFVEQIYWVMMI